MNEPYSRYLRISMVLVKRSLSALVRSSYGFEKIKSMEIADRCKPPPTPGTRVKKQNTKKLQRLTKSPQLGQFFIKFSDLVNLRNGLLIHDLSSHGRGKLGRGSYNHDHDCIMIKAFDELLEPFLLQLYCRVSKFIFL